MLPPTPSPVPPTSPPPSSFPYSAYAGFLFMPSALTAGRRALELIAMRRGPFVNESPWYAVAGESPTFTVTFEGASTLASPSAIVYKDGTNVTATNMPSGSASASGNVVTLPNLTALTAGERYLVALTATVDSQVQIRKIVVIVSDPSSE